MVSNNKVVRFDENVPSYYVTGSRDFQLLTRLLTFALNAAKVKADQNLYLNDPLLIDNNLISLLQTKVGFWTPYEFTDDALRLVCDVFDLAVRRKGSKQGIIEAVEVFLRTLGITTDFDIFIQNKDINGEDSYYIEIGINSSWHDSTLLREILRYILPTGYILSIYYYDLIKFIDKSLLYSDFVLMSAGSTYQVSKIRNSYYSSTTEQWKVLGAKRVEPDTHEEVSYSEYIDWSETTIPQLYLQGVPDGILQVNEKILDSTTAENMTATEPVAYLFKATDETYNGIQSIDMTRIYYRNSQD
jgi:hypothetical protein